MANSGSTYNLLSGATATSAQFVVNGGRYIWSINAGTWNGATATLQVLGADGATEMTVTSTTADTNVMVDCGHNATMRVAISAGPPTNVNSSLRQVI